VNADSYGFSGREPIKEQTAVEDMTRILIEERIAYESNPSTWSAERLFRLCQEALEKLEEK
jgi:hypothetical protein